MGGKTIIIRQIPVPQPRPRVTRWGTYDIAKDKKNWARIQIADQLKPIKGLPLEGPIEMVVTFFLPIPKATSKKKKDLMLSNELKHQKLGDIDNFLKYLFDVMNDLVFKDDKQIWKVQAQKVYSDKPHTKIFISW